MFIRENPPNYIELGKNLTYDSLAEFLESAFWKHYQNKIYGLQAHQVSNNSWNVFGSFISNPIRTSRIFHIKLDEFERIEPIINYLNDVCSKSESEILHMLELDEKSKKAWALIFEK